MQHGAEAGIASSAWFGLAHAVLLVLSFEPIGWWFCAPLSVGAFGCGVLKTRSMRMALLVVFVSQFLAWLWLHRWLMQMTELGWPVLAVYMSLFGVMAAWIFRRASHHPRLARWPAAVVLPIVWVGLECLRGQVVFDGYIWFLLGHALAGSTLLMQSADLFGTYFLSFLLAMGGGAIIDAMRARQQPRWRPVAKITGFIVIVVLVLMIAYSAVRMRQANALCRSAERDGNTLTVLAIQTNLPQSNKIAWTPQQQLADFAEFYRQTLDAYDALHAGDRPTKTPFDLIIWPETMVPGFGLEPQTIDYLVEHNFHPGATYLEALQQLQAETNTPLLVGSPTYIGLRSEGVGSRWQWDRHHNSAYLIDGGQPYQRSDKVFLTPFGERMPYIERWPWLQDKLLGLGASGMTFTLDAASEPRVLELDRSSGGQPSNNGDSTSGDIAVRRTIRIATPICFEATMGSVCRAMVYHAGRKRADVLVNLSNDGWFGWSEAGRAQHAQMSRLRCVENRVPMVRCANTGLSIAYDSAGNVIGHVGEGRYGTGQVPGALAIALPLDGRSTLYSRIGDLWAWLCLGATGTLLALTWRRPAATPGETHP